MIATSTNAGNVASVGPGLSTRIVLYPKKQITYSTNAADITALLTDDYGFMEVSDSLSCCNILVISNVTFTDM